MEQMTRETVDFSEKAADRASLEFCKEIHDLLLEEGGRLAQAHRGRWPNLEHLNAALMLGMLHATSITACSIITQLRSVEGSEKLLSEIIRDMTARMSSAARGEASFASSDMIEMLKEKRS